MEVNIYFSCRVYIAYQWGMPPDGYLWNQSAGGRFNIKTPSYQYRDSRDRLIFNLRIHIPGKTIFILRRGPGLLSLFSSQINSAEDQVSID